MSIIFEKVQKVSRERKSRKSNPIPPESVARVSEFHEALLRVAGEAGADRKRLFRSTENKVHFDRQTAQALARKVKAVAKAQDLPMECAAIPVGRNDAGDALYGVAGWIPRPRQANSITV